MATTSFPSSRGRSLTAVRCRIAADARDLAVHHAIRHLVFVELQRIFAADDRDARDGAATTVRVVGLIGERIAGAVRLYPLDGDGLWQGDRLAVLPEHRVHRLGAELVRFAVHTAGARGGHEMVAQIQPANVRFFELLGWRRNGAPAPFHGVVHQPMAIALRAPPGP
jgi:putative N-acetyltransferase (TIGR04045 family)